MSPDPSGAPRVGYVMSRFPKLSETFVLREMTQLVADGLAVEVLPLIPNRDNAVVHDEARGFQARMRPIEVNSAPALAAWARLMRRQPTLAATLIRQTMAGYARRPAELARALPVLPAGALLAERAQELGLTHLHAHFATYPALAAWVAHRICGIRYSVTAHAHDIYTTHAMLGPKLRDARSVVTISDFNRQYLLDLLGPDLTGRIHVIHCGIRTAEYPQLTCRTDPASPQAPLRLTCVGSLEPYKGQRHLIEAVGILHHRGVAVDLTLVGEGPDRPLLEQAIQDAGVASCVRLAGAATQDQVREILASTDCYVQPSTVMDNGRMEGIPVALMEAMAAGLPVVSTRTSGIPELVRDSGPEPTGWLVEPEDARSLADVLARIARDPGLARARAEAGRELVREEFELRTVTAQLERLFH